MLTAALVLFSTLAHAQDGKIAFDDGEVTASLWSTGRAGDNIFDARPGKGLVGPSSMFLPDGTPVRLVIFDERSSLGLTADVLTSDFKQGNDMIVRLTLAEDSPATGFTAEQIDDTLYVDLYDAIETSDGIAYLSAGGFTVDLGVWNQPTKSVFQGPSSSGWSLF